MTYLYTLLLYLFLPVLLLRLALRGFKNEAYWRRWPERFGFIAEREHAADLWVHAVSVGEVRAAAPLVNHLLEQAPHVRVLVTTMTPTGSAQVRQLFGQQVDHCYAPYDFPDAVARFFNRAKPRAVVILETEIWPNIVARCWSRSIPIVFANVRLSERSFQRYHRVKKLIGATLAKVDAFAVQSERDAERLHKLGANANSITVTGSIKFEVKLPASLSEVGQVLRREWGQERPVWIAGSTHEAEEAAVIDAFRELRTKHPRLLLVIVPRHPERFSTVAKLCQRAGLRVARRSETHANLAEDTEVYIGDTMGELTLFYAASDVAFVGGSLVPIGGHNVLEPCALGVPVVFGPNMFNFQDISELTLERNAGFMISDTSELVDKVDTLLGDPNRRFKMGEAGTQLIEENRGALQHTLAVLKREVPAVFDI